MALFGVLDRRAERLHVVVDIGSHAIKAIVVRGRGDEVPKAVKKIVLKLPLRAEPSTSGKFAIGPRLPPSVIGKLRELIFVVVRELGRVPDKVLVALSASAGEEEISVWQGAPAHVGRIISRDEIARHFENLKRAYAGEAKGEFFVYPLAILVNGYETSLDAVCRQGAQFVQEFGFRVLTIRLPQGEEKLFGLSQSFGGIPLSFVPLAAAYASVMWSTGIAPDALLVDVGGEKTSVVLVRDGELAGVAAFFYGTHHMVRSFAGRFSTSLRIADQIFSQYLHGTIDSQKRARVATVAGSEVAAWMMHFQEAVIPFTAGGSIPADVMFVGGGARIPELAAAMQKGEWVREYSHHDAPQVRIGDPHQPFGGDGLDGFLQGPEDCGLAALIRYSYAYEPIF